MKTMKMNWTKEMFLEVFGKEGCQKMIDETYELLEGQLSKEQIVKAIVVGFNNTKITDDIYQKIEG